MKKLLNIIHENNDWMNLTRDGAGFRLHFEPGIVLNDRRWETAADAVLLLSEVQDELYNAVMEGTVYVDCD